MWGSLYLTGLPTKPPTADHPCHVEGELGITIWHSSSSLSGLAVDTASSQRISSYAERWVTATSPPFRGREELGAWPPGQDFYFPLWKTF